jgi:hypothetical protein
LSLALILAIVVCGLFYAVGSLLERLHRAALSTQPIWQFITYRSQYPLNARCSKLAISVRPRTGFIAAGITRIDFFEKRTLFA